jgi:type VI protein secretion system component VasF
MDTKTLRDLVRTNYRQLSRGKQSMKARPQTVDIKTALEEFLAPGEEIMRGEKVEKELEAYFTNLEALRIALQQQGYHPDDIDTMVDEAVTTERWQKYLQNGGTVPNDAVMAWLDTWEKDREP